MKILYKILFLTIIPLLLLSGCRSVGRMPSGHIIILYDNDVHCSVEGYAKMAAMKQELSNSANHVAVVSSGDFIQGGMIGNVSHGESIIKIMNQVGYDVVALGNHEFGYGVPHLSELVRQCNAAVVCSNFYKDSSLVFAPYAIKQLGNRKIAFIGVTTPSAKASNPLSFKSEDDRYAFSLPDRNFFDEIQLAVNKARKEGADYVVALTHLGIAPADEPYTSTSLIEATDGIDAVIDAHSHDTLSQRWHYAHNQKKKVLLTSSGSNFAHIGCLSINSRGEFSSMLIPTKSYSKKDSATEALISQLSEETHSLGERKVGYCEAELIAKSEAGSWLVRKVETGMGDFVTDAILDATQTDIAVINGGAIRDNLHHGTISYNDIYNVLPFENTICTGYITTEQLLDALEYAVSKMPSTSGGFLQIAGFRFEVDTTIPSPVRVDENGQLKGIASGPRRVSKLEILNKQGEYQDITQEKSKVLTIASNDFLMLGQGDGNAAMECRGIIETHTLMLEVLESYISRLPQQTIPARYAKPEGRIRIARRQN